MCVLLALDLEIVGDVDSDVNPSSSEIRDLEKELTTILGDGRVKVGDVLSKAENEALNDGLRRGIASTPDIPNPRTVG